MDVFVPSEFAPTVDFFSNLSTLNCCMQIV